MIILIDVGYVMLTSLCYNFLLSFTDLVTLSYVGDVSILVKFLLFYTFVKLYRFC